MKTCPQCGEDTPELFEGYCRSCRDMNQSMLDLFNEEYARWSKMKPNEREAAIKWAIL